MQFKLELHFTIQISTLFYSYQAGRNFLSLKQSQIVGRRLWRYAFTARLTDTEVTDSYFLI